MSGKSGILYTNTYFNLEELFFFLFFLKQPPPPGWLTFAVAVTRNTSPRLSKF